MDTIKELKKGAIAVVIIPNAQYTNDVLDIARFLSQNHKPVCYINFNRPFSSLAMSLKNKGIDNNNFLFIDAVTKAASQKPEGTDNCIFISSASALTQLSLVIDKALKTGKINSILFDSLSTILIYNKSAVACKFVHDIINKIRNSNVTTVFTALEGDAKSELLNEVSMFIDKIIGAEEEDIGVTAEKLKAKGLIK